MKNTKMWFITGIFGLSFVIGLTFGLEHNSAQATTEVHVSRWRDQIALKSTIPLLARASSGDENKQADENLITDKKNLFDTIACEGTWIYTDSLGEKIPLAQTSIAGWTFESTPSILSETFQNDNTVIIGHNYCSNGNCYSPTTSFAKIINAQIGEEAAFCMNGKLSMGSVVKSQPVDEKDVYILDNWLGTESVTLFTCYGECKDTVCSSTKQRWVVAFEVM